MFFDQPTQLLHLAQYSGFAIFVLPASLWPQVSRAYVLSPEAHTKITIDQVRELSNYLKLKFTEPHFIIVKYANQLTPQVANALLKTLEEPKPNLHIVFLAEALSGILPTIRSRAQLFFLRVKKRYADSPAVSDLYMQLAKQLIESSARFDLAFISDLAKRAKSTKTDHVDLYSLVQFCIELLVKTYFMTYNPSFLIRLERFLRLEAALRANGHTKLHLVADLL